MTEAEGWHPIATAPRDGTRIVLYWPNYCYSLEEREHLMPSPYTGFGFWKINKRIVRAHRGGEWLDLQVGYFADTDEADDYGLADPKFGPSHWRPEPEPPV